MLWVLGSSNEYPQNMFLQGNLNEYPQHNYIFMEK